MKREAKVRKMTDSQPTEVGGFSRKPLNLNHFGISYTKGQQGKDVFEYSIFGDSQGQTKIGDFSC